MGKYNKMVADNSKLEMIHVSLDRDEKSAEGWAAKENFPWLTILPGDVEKSGMREYKTTRFVPEYALLDKDGKRLASGGQEVFQKAVELTSDEA